MVSRTVHFADLLWFVPIPNIVEDMVMIAVGRSREWPLVSYLTAHDWAGMAGCPLEAVIDALKVTSQDVVTSLPGFRAAGPGATLLKPTC